MEAARRIAAYPVAVTIAGGLDARAEQTRSMIICLVSELSLAIDIECVGEVIRAAETVPVAAPDPTMLGYLNVRGSHVPAIDAASALGLQARRMQPSDRFVILETSSGQVAILVQEVVSIADVVPIERSDEAVDTAGGHRVTAPGRLSGEQLGVVAIVDCDRLGHLARGR